MSDTITLSVDVANDGNLVNSIFTKARTLLNGARTLFFGPTHETSLPDTLAIYVSDAKPNGNFKGVTRPGLKRTSTIVVPGIDPTTSITSPLIGNVEFSVPVGATSEECMILRQELIAALDDDTIMEPLMMQSIAPFA
jgi:hypothetical protein